MVFFIKTPLSLTSDQFYKSHLLDCTTLSVPLPLDGKLANIKLENGVIMEARALFNFNARDSEVFRLHPSL